ncbi:TPA: hypothetical protein OXL58_002169 [Acinetobacter baumannii]|uniref:hypothetical protein n=1 Tax=Acinetobacter baumannii TaxID=470 RepID=UPI0022A09A98|nr:hypothetical protein [Acinetobacter baumannii]MDC5359956.1 hypothetical protein [Acinetobacter baumannii]MDC5467470.1 hypothetical protein [Acinetobacter baumannii]MDH2504125.1 hypothetical protein [Acinetobacter baumannii]MDH2533182.1 hypothetical protein [Acinetobacter baumannii]MDV7523972.1 hypothetical protein [Acinetobacter baumannii]
MMFDKENFEFSEINSALSHLTPEEITNLVNDYYSGIKVSELIEHYNIAVLSSKLVSLFPPVKINSECEFCNLPMITKLNSKSSYEQLSRKDIICPKCQHQQNRACTCLKCREKVKLEELEKKRQQESLNNKKIAYLEQLQKIPSISEEELSLTDKIYLASLLRECLHEDAEYIEEVNQKGTAITPYLEFTSELLQHLLSRRLIIPYLINDLDQFQEEEDGSITYFIYYIKYKINIQSKDGNYQMMLHRLMYPRSDEFLEDSTFCYEFWKKIAFYESIQYLMFKMESVRYDFSPGTKTYTVFQNLVNNFSVGQIYNIIYRAIANSTEQYQSGKITKIHAQNMVISSCEGQGERAIANNWDLKNYARVKELPQSQISKIFFDSILQISYLGFSEKPTRRL